MSNVVTIAVPMGTSAGEVLSKLWEHYEVKESRSFVATVKTNFVGKKEVNIIEETAQNKEKAMPTLKRA